MKIIVTGSLGHISKPLTRELLAKGHRVSVISSQEARKEEIEALGAIPCIGSLEDLGFLEKTFLEADAAYCMIPPNFSERDQVAYYRRLTLNYAEAVRKSQIKNVVELSSYGAHLEKGTGFIVGSHHVERIWDGLSGISVAHIRAGYFYYNLLNFIPMIRSIGSIGANYGGPDKLALVSPEDIALAITEELDSGVSKNRIRYVVSDDRSCDEVASVLGNSIGLPDLRWTTLTSEQMRSGLEAGGVPSYIASYLVELGEATHSGALREEYEKTKTKSGRIKLEDFAQEFLEAFRKAG
ncbi:NAD(P)H-binding protein [Leptospira wolffii]|uniref:NmrA family NAD(P)-binding protein n=1 Tax=Leptospira wolffii TaxID=409998 RepID=UPI0002DA0FF7|nr:NAD(P)H-binding protein [Leptospira wolffii]EPG66590.1 NAD(P)H-binding protein, PF13460 family [Leptospira wolffii serovar Khorat str. Khorat-H2]